MVKIALDAVRFYGTIKLDLLTISAENAYLSVLYHIIVAVVKREKRKDFTGKF